MGPSGSLEAVGGNGVVDFSGAGASISEPRSQIHVLAFPDPVVHGGGEEIALFPIVDSFRIMSSSSSGNGLVLMWSGGKDAMLTHDVLHSQSPRRVDALLTTVVEGVETVTMHGTPLALIERQAEALDLPLHVMRVPPNASNATYQTRLERALGPLLAEGYRHVAAGDLFLEDVKAYRERALSAVGAVPLFPLWKRDPAWLSQHFLRRGYRAVVTSVDQTQLSADVVGRAYDESFLADLPEGVDPCGEHGAFHTFVTDGPPFRTSVPVEMGKPHGEGRMRYVSLHGREEGAAE